MSNDRLGRRIQPGTESAGTNRASYLPGLRTATVVSIADPKKAGRVQVRVHTLHAPDVPQSVLPWAYTLTPDGPGTPSAKHGTRTRYAVGSAVMVDFLDGNTSTPVVVGGWTPVNTIPPELEARSDGVPVRTGSKTETGFSDVVTEDPQQPESSRVIATPAGTVVRIVDDDSTGERRVEVELSGNMSFKLNETTGVATLTAEKVVVDSDNIHIGQDGMTPNLDGAVQRSCKCAFTGLAHPDFATVVKIQKD